MCQVLTVLPIKCKIPSCYTCWSTFVTELSTTYSINPLFCDAKLFTAWTARTAYPTRASYMHANAPLLTS